MKNIIAKIILFAAATSAFCASKPVTYEPTTGAISQPANFATANGIVNNDNVATVAGKLYRDFYVYVDMRMSPSIKGIWLANPAVNNKFYYKDSTGAVKQTLSSSGAAMATYTDANSYYDMQPWTDFEIKVIDKFGNNIYFSSTIYLNSTSVMNGHSEIIDSTPKIYYLSTRNSDDYNKCYGAKTAFTNFNSSIGATVGNTYIVSGVWLYPSIDSTERRTVPVYKGYDSTSGYKSVVWGEYIREIFTNPENLIIVWRQTTTTGETDAAGGYQFGRKRWIVVQPTFYGDFKLKN